MSQGPFGNPPPGPPPKSGGSNTMMIIIIVAVVGLIVCGGCCGVGGYFFYRVGTEAADLGAAQLDAFKAINAQSEVQEKIGSSLPVVPPVKTELSNELDSATVDYELKGEAGSGKAIIGYQKQSGNWKATKITVTFADGTTVDIDPAAGKAPGEVNIPFEIPEDAEMESN